MFPKLSNSPSINPDLANNIKIENASKGLLESPKDLIGSPTSLNKKRKLNDTKTDQKVIHCLKNPQGDFASLNIANNADVASVDYKVFILRKKVITLSERYSYERRLRQLYEKEKLRISIYGTKTSMCWKPPQCDDIFNQYRYLKLIKKGFGYSKLHVRSYTKSTDMSSQGVYNDPNNVHISTPYNMNISLIIKNSHNSELLRRSIVLFKDIKDLKMNINDENDKNRYAKSKYPFILKRTLNRLSIRIISNVDEIFEHTKLTHFLSELYKLTHLVIIFDTINILDCKNILLYLTGLPSIFIWVDLPVYNNNNVLEELLPILHDIDRLYGIKIYFTLRQYQLYKFIQDIIMLFDKETLRILNCIINIECHDYLPILLTHIAYMHHLKVLKITLNENNHPFIYIPNIINNISKINELITLEIHDNLSSIELLNKDNMAKFVYLEHISLNIPLYSRDYIMNIINGLDYLIKLKSLSIYILQYQHSHQHYQHYQSQQRQYHNNIIACLEYVKNLRILQQILSLKLFIYIDLYDKACWFAISKILTNTTTIQAFELMYENYIEYIPLSDSNNQHANDNNVDDDNQASDGQDSKENKENGDGQIKEHGCQEMKNNDDSGDGIYSFLDILRTKSTLREVMIKTGELLTEDVFVKTCQILRKLKQLDKVILYYMRNDSVSLALNPYNITYYLRMLKGLENIKAVYLMMPLKGTEKEIMNMIESLINIMQIKKNTKFSIVAVNKYKHLNEIFSEVKKRANMRNRDIQFNIIDDV